MTCEYLAQAAAWVVTLAMAGWGVGLGLRRAERRTRRDPDA